jgi:TolB-like protein/Tfp pilus assembly protein PilF
MSDDPKQEIFCDGITEEIITGLAKLPGLFVIARNSTFAYKGKAVKVQQLAQDLGVRYVLEGSVRKSDENLRITAQLVDTIKGHHLWADRWDRKLEDLFAIQDDITMSVATALQVELTEGVRARAIAKGTKQLDAYLKALEANEYILRFNPEGNAIARRLAEEAVAIDPRYAFAYALLGKTYMVEIWLGASRSQPDSLASAIRLEEKAIEIDESLGAAYSILGFLYTMAGQHERGVLTAEKGVALEPSSDLAHQALGLALRFGGRPTDAVPVIEKALRLNPMAPSTYLFNLGLAYLFSGQKEEAVAACEKAAMREPNNLGAQLALTVAYSMSGRDESALTAAEKVLKINPKFYTHQFAKSLTYKNEADRDRFIDALRKAGLPETPPLPLPDKPSIAVLPFDNMSGDPEQEYFADGITEEIITALSKIPKLFVIARNSTFIYKGKSVSVPTVARELGVQYVMEGSVRKAGNRLRVTAQLIDVKTNDHIWAEKYDRELKDIFAVQDDITKNIISALQVKLTEGEQANIYAKGTSNLEAYLKVMKANWLYLQGTKLGVLKALDLAGEAITVDPGYAFAYKVLGGAHGISVWLGLSNHPQESLRQAIELHKKAVELDGALAVAHMGLGYWLVMARQYDEGVVEGERAMALEPGSADVIHGYAAILTFVGRQKEAIPFFKEALRLNPYPPNTYLRHYCIALLNSGLYEETIAQTRRAIEKEPDDLLSYVVMTASYSLAGREEEARMSAKEVLRINPRFSVARHEKISPSKDRAAVKRFGDSLRMAGLPE